MAEQFDNEVKIIVTADTEPAQKEINKFKGKLKDGAQQGQKYGDDVSGGINKGLKKIKLDPNIFSGIMSGVSAAVIASMTKGFHQVVKSQALSSEISSIVSEITREMDISRSLTDSFRSGKISEDTFVYNNHKIDTQIEKLNSDLKKTKAELNGLVEETRVLADNAQVTSTNFEKVKDTVKESKSKVKSEDSSGGTSGNTTDDPGPLEETIITRLARRVGLHESMLKTMRKQVMATQDVKTIVGGLLSEGKSVLTVVLKTVGALIKAYPIVAAILGVIVLIKAIIDSMRKTVEWLIKTIKTALSIIRTLTLSLYKTVGDIGKLLAQFSISEIKLIGKAINSIFISIKSGIKSSYNLFKKLFSLWKISYSDAMNNIYAWAELNNNVLAKSLDLITTDINAIQNAIAVMVMPLLERIAPVVDAITDKILVLANAVAKLMAQLAGKSSYVKVTKAAKKFAEENDKAANSVKKLLLNIDELQKLDENDSDIDTIANSFAEELEDIEKLDFNAFDFGKNFGERIKEWLEDINWSTIKSKAADIGTKLANILNGIFSTKDFGTTVGNSLAQALNTAFAFLENYISTINVASITKQVSDLITSFFTNINYDSIYNTIVGLANNIVTAFNTFIGDDVRVEAVARGIANLFKTAIDAVTTLLDGLNIGKLVDNIVVMANALLSDTDRIEKLTLSILNFLSKSVQGVFTLINDIKWEDLVASMVNAINTFLNDNSRVEKLSTSIYNLISKACKVATSTIKNIDWDKLVENITGYIRNAIKALDGQSIGDAIIKLFNAALNLAIKAPWAELAKFGSDVLWRIISEMPTVFKNVPGAQVANKISEVLNIIIDDIQPDKIASAVNAFVQWVGEFWTTVKDKVNWKDLVDKICQAIRNVDWAKALEVVWEVIVKCWVYDKIFKGKVIATIVKDMIDDWHKQLASKLSNFTGMGESIAHAIVKGIQAILSLVNPFTPLWDKIAAVKSAISNLGFGSSKNSNYDSDNGYSYYASGGVVTKPTRAIVGEYAGASSNPEIITPENKMREVFAEGNSALANVYISVGRQIISAIENQNLEVSIGDDVIAKSASRGNNSYMRMTGQSLFAT